MEIKKMRKSQVILPQLRADTFNYPYCAPDKRWYSPTSRVYNSVLDLTAKSFFYGKGAPPNNTPDFKRAWMSFVRDQGVRIYRKIDWNIFWRRVHMTVIMYQVKNLGNKEFTPMEGLLKDRIGKLVVDMPTQKPVLSRGAFFGSYINDKDMETMRNILQSMLVYTAEACDQEERDYPGWFSETDNLIKALDNGLFLREERKKYYVFTSNGVGNVGDVDVRPYGLADDDGVMIQDQFYSLDDAKKLAYTILESVRYVEEQSHVAQQVAKQSATNSTNQTTKGK